MTHEEEALRWQTGVWDRMADVYAREIDPRFAPVVDHVLKRAGLKPGDVVLDLGTGTGTAAVAAARLVAPEGNVTGIDISTDMLALARARATETPNVTFEEGRAGSIPAEDAAFDALIASLSFMYVVDRPAAAQECARVLKPRGRFVAAVWAGPDHADIVRFQATAGRFAPPPPVQGVGPGALADPTALIESLRDAGIDAGVEIETVLFEFDDLDHAWQVLAGVTTAMLSPEKVEEAKAAVRETMWPDPTQPRVFSNTTQFIVGTRR